MFDSLTEKITGAFKHLSGQGKVSEKNIEAALADIRQSLLEADVHFKVVKEFIQKVKEKSLGEKVLRGVKAGEQFTKIVQDELAEVMGGQVAEINWDQAKPLPVLIAGLNGAGKTTFSAKLCHYLKTKKQKRFLLVPADTFRPAAKEQLLTLARQKDLEFFDSDLSDPPELIAQKALDKAKQEGFDGLIVDTAGRLHVDQELMEQIRRVKSALPQSETLLVADAMTGQEAIHMAQEFHQALDLTGVVLSKMDSDARGGATLSIRAVVGRPLYFISTGEKLEDLELFHPDRMASRILDRGDVVTLVEKAQEVVDEKEAEKLMTKMEKQTFSIADFMQQMKNIGRLGSMESLLKMIPGMGGMMRQMGDLSPAQEEMKKMQVIASSMTAKERDDRKLLKTESRRQRVARGSGTSLQDVNTFLTKFDQMKKMMGGLVGGMKNGQMPAMPGMGGGTPQKMRKKGKGKGNPWGRRYF